jgi:aminoglycoside 3-N-acetyltransferase
VTAAITRSQLARQLRDLGVAEGGALMVHTRMSAIGWVVGGAGGVVGALLDALGPRGTLLAYASWEEHVYHAGEWPQAHVEAYRAEPPVFDVATAEAARDHGRVPERVRTWPGARRSFHPEAMVVAVGAGADRFTCDHPQEDGYGPGSPFGRLCDVGGQVLMLGAPLDTITLLHHAEAIARVPAKRTVTFTIPVLDGGRVVSRSYTDIDTSRGAYDYERLGLGEDEFAVIGREALEAGIGSRGRVGSADCALFGARELTAFGVAWIEAHFA